MVWHQDVRKNEDGESPLCLDNEMLECEVILLGPKQGCLFRRSIEDVVQHSSARCSATTSHKFPALPTVIA